MKPTINKKYGKCGAVSITDYKADVFKTKSKPQN